MKIYVVETMTNADYNSYMSGSHYYDVNKMHIEAETKEEAIAKAKTVADRVNENYILTVEELEAIERRKAEERAEEKRKEEEAKAKRKAKEEAKAESFSLTVEEYRKAKANKSKISKYEREIKELEKELAYKKKALAKAKAEAEKWGI